MNVQPNKKIIFSKSSLLSLKAELHKKREEVLDKKQLPENRIENFKRPSAKGSEKSGDKEPKKSFKDALKAVDTEELEACRKSKLALEMKAELYEHLADSAGESQLAGRFLVDFKTKKDEAVKEAIQQMPQEEIEEKADSVLENDDEWVEFTDCLGRTRKCHKSDVEMFKQRDKDLMRIMFNDGQDGNTDGESSQNQEPQKEKTLLVRTTNDYLQSLRQKWEEKERNLLAKDKDIHYQDLLFDEARIHGVGYYAFSTDESERQKQMQQLLKEREATLQAQKEAEEKRKKRDEIIAARVKAARARQRMRAGLPPEEPEETTKDFTAQLLEFLTQQRNEAEAKAKEEENKKKEELEKERQKLREAYIREWDLGKEGVDEKIKKFREMTQEEYVEQQRNKRIDEFAPPKATSGKSNNTFDDHGKIVANREPKSWSDVRPKAVTPPPPDIGDLKEQKGLYFSTKNLEPGPSNMNKKEVKYKNFVRPQEPIPIFDEINHEFDVERKEPQQPTLIVNELDNDEFDIGRKDSQQRNNQFSGAEVAPPPTFDYYGPVTKRPKFEKPFESDIREAYEQGAKSLETKSKCRQISKDYDFMF